MLNFASFRKGLHIQPSDDNFAYSQGRTLNFRQIFLEATERRLPATQAIAASSWKAFYALFLNHTQRNVFYRLIHHKIPTRLQRSHCNSPTVFDPLVIFIVALAEVWKAHWRFMFDAAPLTTNSLFVSFQRVLKKLQAEDNLPLSAG
ncbi:hypothetical protein BD408DRAFT_433973 [Parasitella parasitica]|nr:hypothetical protein BD408DRAFT_433973 [Parasitella parasitica]